MELKVLKSNALRAWRNADSKGRSTLEDLYGKETFENQDVRERIKTFVDALKETRKPDVPDFSYLPESDRAYFIAQYKMSVIVEALNEGWEPDWNDDNQRKWRPWFKMSASSFAFDLSYCDDSCAAAGAGLAYI